MEPDSSNVVPLRPRPHRREYLTVEVLRSMHVGDRILDTGVGGLFAERGRRVTSFRLQVDMPARHRRALVGAPRSLLLTVGRWPAMSPRKARAKALALKGLVADGKDPRQPRNEAGATVRVAWENYQTHLRRTNASPATFEAYEHSFDRLKAWHDEQLASIARDRTGLLEREHDRMVDKHGAVAAAMTLQHLGIWYRRLAGKRDLPQWPKHAYTPQPARSRARDRRVPEEELPVWRAKVERIKDPVMRQLLLFLLYSGLRKTDALTLRWTQISVRRRRARIVEPKGGSKREFILPLSRQMLRCLLAAKLAWRKAGHRRTRWVFPSLRSESGHLQDCRAVVKGERVRTGHALRHSFENLARASGIAREDRSVLLNHAAETQTEEYGDPTTMVAHFLPIMQRVSDRIEAALGGPKQQR